MPTTRPAAAPGVSQASASPGENSTANAPARATPASTRTPTASSRAGRPGLASTATSSMIATAFNPATAASIAHEGLGGVQLGLRRLEEAAQVAVAEEQRLGVELGEEPERDEHQPGVGGGAGAEEAVPQRMRAAPGDHGAPDGDARERAEEPAEDVGGDIEVGGDAIGQVVLERLEHEAQAGGERHGARRRPPCRERAAPARAPRAGRAESRRRRSPRGRSR